MAITVFPSANAVGSAGQKVYSEPNMRKWIAALTPRNYIVTGLDVSGAGTTTLTISPGAAIVAGHLVTISEAITMVASSSGFYAIRLSLARDSLTNVTDAACQLVSPSTALTSDDLLLAYAYVTTNSQIMYIDYTQGRYTSPYGTPYDDWVNKASEYSTFFDSLDGFTTNGTVALDKSGYVRLSTAASSGATASLVKYSVVPTGCRSRPDFSYEQWLSTELTFTGHAEYGFSEVWSIVGAPGVKRHIGLVILDGKIYGTVGNGTTETRTALIDTSNDSAVTVHYVPGQYAEFWAGPKRAVLTTGLPSSDETLASDKAILYVSVKTLEARAKTLELSSWRWRQSLRA